MRRWIGGVAMVFFVAVLAASGWIYLRDDGVSDRTRVVATTSTTVRSSDVPETTVPTTVPAETTTTMTTPTPTGPDLDLGEVPVASGRPEDVAVPVVRQPIRLEIGDLSIQAAIEPVGYDAENDEMEVPQSASVAGWYEFSATPGEAGSAVLAAHVDWNGRQGAFFDLYLSEVGTRVVVEFDDGTFTEFEVFAAEQYDKKALPTDEIFTRQGEPVLTLITCGGVFNESVRSYEDNVVVFARPVG